MKLSVIIPVLNEAGTIQACIDQPALDDTNVEIIVVDGGCSDDTVDVLNQSVNDSVRLIDAPVGRASQMNAGAAIASGDIFIFLHADTRLPENALKLIGEFYESASVWGRFDVKINDTRMAYRVISWFINKRSRLSGIATGDQVLFFKSNHFRTLGGFPDTPLMEDVEISRRFKVLSRPYCLKERVVTSARKWQKEGLVKTVILMWQLRLLYFLGVPAKSLVKKYYPNIKLSD